MFASLVSRRDAKVTLTHITHLFWFQTPISNITPPPPAPPASGLSASDFQSSQSSQSSLPAQQMHPQRHYVSSLSTDFALSPPADDEENKPPPSTPRLAKSPRRKPLGALSPNTARGGGVGVRLRGVVVYGVWGMGCRWGLWSGTRKGGCTGGCEELCARRCLCYVVRRGGEEEKSRMRSSRIPLKTLLRDSHAPTPVYGRDFVRDKRTKTHQDAPRHPKTCQNTPRHGRNLS